MGNNAISGRNVTIASSTVNGTLNLEGGQATLTGVLGGSVVATDTKVVLEHSTLSSLELGTGATASMDPASSSLNITPQLPVLTISAPGANSSYTGNIQAQVTVSGSGVASLTFLLDGRTLPSLSGGNLTGPQVTYPLDTASMPDGTHTLTVTAVQSDLLTSSASVSFQTHNQLAAVTNDLSAANQTIRSLSGSLQTANGDISQLRNTVNALSYGFYLAVAIAFFAVALAVYSLRSGKATRSA